MSHLLLNLRHVPEDEADEVRALLDRHGIGVYERRRIDGESRQVAIWVREEAQLLEARRIMTNTRRAEGAGTQPVRSRKARRYG